MITTVMSVAEIETLRDLMEKRFENDMVIGACIYTEVCTKIMMTDPMVLNNQHLFLREFFGMN